MNASEKPPGTRSGTDILTGLCAVLALLVLVLGVPAALATFIGWPLPRTLPTLATLQQPITLTTLQHVLAVVVWLAWAQFTACVIVEARAEISGVGMPARVPGVWGSQLLARQLVATTLLLVASVGSFTPGMSSLAADHAERPAAVTRVVTQAVPPASGPVSATLPPAAGAGESTGSRAEAAPTVTQAVTQAVGQTVVPAVQGEVKKIYTVHPPQGRHHESLWEIADRHLGDGRRYREIFELNKAQEQPDGEKLHIAKLIRPGWVLVMPLDAVGCEIVRSDPPAPAHSSGTGTGTGTEQTEQTGSTATVRAEQPSADTGSSPEDSSEVSSGDSPSRVPYELAAATLLGAGVLTALGRRRRQQLWHRAFGRRVHAPSPDAAAAEEAVRLGADPAGAAVVDLGLRALSASLAEAGRSLPAVYAARLHGGGLDLLLSRPERDAPPPWTATGGGAVWHLPAASGVALAESGTRARELRGVLAPYPGLVSLGVDASGRMLVDLEAASGVIGLRGPAEASRAVLAAVAAELATNRWSDHMRLTLVGFGDELRLLAPERVASAASLSEVLPELEARAVETQRALAASGVDSVLTGRCQGIAGEAWMPHFLIVAEAPEPAEAARLARLASVSARMPAGYLVAGEVPGQSWTWDTGEPGRLRVPLLDLDVEAQRLPEAQYAAVVDLFRATYELRGDPSDDTPPGAPALAGVSIEELQHPAPVDLRMLGPVEVRVPGQLEEGRVASCTEMLVYLATHREGVHPTVLGGAVWPRGVSAAVRDATLARVRDWLGRDATGQSHLLTGAEGRLRLGPGVRTDWEVFATLVRLAAADPAAEVTYLEQALALVRGPVLADRPRSRYIWLASETLEYEVPARIADAAQRLAAVRLDDGDPEGAVAAVRAGLRGAPDDEALLRTLLRVTHAIGEPGRLRAVVAELRQPGPRQPGPRQPGSGAGSGAGWETGWESGREIGRDVAAEDLHPETEALIDELLPSWRLSVAT